MQIKSGKQVTKTTKYKKKASKNEHADGEEEQYSKQAEDRDAKTKKKPATAGSVQDEVYEYSIFNF